MATYDELYALRNDSALKNCVNVARGSTVTVGCSNCMEYDHGRIVRR